MQFYRRALAVLAALSVFALSFVVNSTSFATLLDSPTAQPTKPTLVSPTANQTLIGDASPIFTWEPNPAEEEVTDYRLFVRDSNNAILVNALFAAGSVCPGDVCAADLSELPAPVNLVNGDYSFRVRAINNDGSTDSNYRPFSIIFPAKTVLVSPIDNVVLSDAQPEFTWTELFNAAEYRLTIYDAAKQNVGGTIWLDSVEANCNGTNCSFDLTPTSLINGAYTWNVEARNTAISPNKSKSAAGAFKISFPGAPELVSPIDSVVISDIQPEFTWTEVEAAAEYRLTIYDAAKTKVGGTIWLVSAQVNCNGTNCSFDIVPSSLPNGVYTWVVETRNTETGPGKSKSATGTFKISFPGVPVLTSPSDGATMDVASPTFTWEGVEGATQYRLIIIRTAKPTPPALNQVFESADICVSNTCTVDLATLEIPVALKNGAHTWQVKAIAPGGYTSQTTKHPFTVSLPLP